VTAHDDTVADDRRRSDRRVDDLERKYSQLANALQRVEIEQVNARDVMKSRFDALNNGQLALVGRMDAVKDLLIASIGEPASSPAGRALSRDIQRISDECASRWEQIDSLVSDRAEVRGVLRIMQYVGIGGLGAVALALLKSFGVIFHGGTP
jgi:hypothetical protein